MVYALIIPKMDVLILFVTFVAGVLQIILFFKVWGMTNNVDKIQEFLTSTDNDEYIKFLKAYTDDDITPTLQKVFNLKDGCKRDPKYGWRYNHKWLEEYKYEIGGCIYCSCENISSKRIFFKIIAECNGDPRLKASWSFKPAAEGNEVPEALKA